MELQPFLESNIRKNLEALDLATLDYKTVSEVAKMTMAEVKAASFIILCDNPQWAARGYTVNNKECYYSSDGSEYVYTPTASRESMLRYEFINNRLDMRGTTKLQFAGEEPAMDLDKVIENKNQKEEIVMPTDDMALDAMINQANVELGQPTGGVTPMTSFGGESASAETPTSGRKQQDPKAKELKQAEREQSEQLRRRIKDDVQKAAQDNPVDVSVVESTWKKMARLICFVAPTDLRQSITAIKVPTKSGKRELTDTAPDDVKAMFLKDQSSVPAQYIKQTFEVKARESKPGKPTGVIVRIPAYLKGLSTADYMKSICTEQATKYLSSDDSATAIELLSMTEFEQKLTFVGSSILEADETAPDDGKPGEIVIRFGQPNSNAVASDGVLSDGGIVFAKKLIKVGQGNKTPMHDRNYFPLTTYECVDISTNMDPQVVADLNSYLFSGWFEPGKAGGKQTEAKINQLTADAKPHIRKKGDVVESDYITNDSGRLDLTVTAFYDKNKSRGKIMLPIKRKNPKPDGSLGSPQFVKYNCTQEDQLNDPTYRAKTALGLEKFAHIVKIVGEDVLDPAVLKEKFKKPGSGASVNKYIDADIARDLLRIKMAGGLDHYMINGFSF